MKFSEVEAVRVPNGSVVEIKSNGLVMWDNCVGRYVSFGDSIAAGHAINEDWEKDYGEGSQYGRNGNTATKLVPGCYTDLIRADLMERKGGNISVTSYAVSGDTVGDLIDILHHDGVRKTLARADYVTLCIGANDVLQPALMNIDQYINAGDLSGITAMVEANLQKLADDSYEKSYKALFDLLLSINYHAKFVFTTIYNPYKYLWLEESTREHDYKNGFLGPLMWTVPDFIGDVAADAFRRAFLETDIVRNLFERVNGVGAWAETHVTALNNILRTKINNYGNANFLMADTKAVFDCVPDRIVSAPKHYNDLVNVEPTRGYVVEDLDWGQFWGNIDWASALSNIGNIANEVMDNVLEHVILPDIDPHPEWYGHEAMRYCFEDALGWSTLTKHTVSFHANGGSGAMDAQVVTALPGMAAYVPMWDCAYTTPGIGYHFAGWNTAADGSGTTFTKGQVVAIESDMTLYAQWTNMCVITVRHSYDSYLHGEGDTGPMESYALWIDGTEQPDLGAFRNGPRVITLPYGSQVGVIVQTKSGSARSYITLNGEKIAGNSSDARWTFNVTGDMDIHYEWNYWIDGITPQSYWNCYVTTYE